MLCSGMQIVLLALCSSLLVTKVNAAPQTSELTETLQAELVSEKDVTGLLMMKFLSELMASDGEETLRELEEDDLGGRRRPTTRHVRFTHRPRKAGCRNFFWKTFTSC